MDVDLLDLDVANLVDSLRGDSVVWLDFNHSDGVAAYAFNRLSLKYDISGAVLADYRRGKSVDYGAVNPLISGQVADISLQSIYTRDATFCFVVKFDNATALANEAIFVTGATSGGSAQSGIALWREGGYNNRLQTWFSDGTTTILMGAHDLAGLDDGEFHLLTMLVDRTGLLQLQVDLQEPSTGLDISAQQASIYNTYQDILGIWPGYTSPMAGNVALYTLHHRLLTRDQIRAIFQRYV